MIRLFLLAIFIIHYSVLASAGSRFTSSYPCADQAKICASSGKRTVDGFEVSKDCWEYSYVKTCNYPSKNNCSLYEHCYAVANRECLLKDSLGNCVNLKREFSCKSWISTQKENIEARVDLVAKDGEDSIVCKGIPCLDGNCVDKSYLTNGEMMDSVSKLYATSNMKPDQDHNFNLFAGFGNHCSKKPVGFSNCCPDTSKGWGKQLGAKCTKDEISLINLREKKLCVYVGKKTSGTAPFHVNKHHYCCFGNTLERVIQVEGRKQLGINFGSGGSPNCRGLTMEEITGYDKDGKKVGKGLDFSKMDFSDFIDELMVKFTGAYKTPNPKEIAGSIKTHMNIKEYDGNEDNPENRFAGLNANIKDDSWEAGEEKRILAESLEQERLEQNRQAEKLRLEQEQLQEIARKKDKIRIEQQNIQNQIAQKEQALVKAKDGEKAATLYWNNTGHKVYSSNHSGYQREWDKVQVWRDKCAQLDSDVRTLKYKLTRLR
jgi:conjugal transfer mating pair stabilization protein TraN